jgi:hypothetical protein
VTRNALSRALDHLGLAAEELERAKREVPPYSVEALTFHRAEIKVLARRLENTRRALGDSNLPPAA